MSPTNGDDRGGVQSVNRALDVLEIMATGGGVLPLGEIAASSGLALPTIHRLLRTLVDRGYVRQLPNRQYALGFRLVPLGTLANAQVGANAEGVLADLVGELGESANMAVLAGDRAQYVAQAQSTHQMRMFTEVGRRVELHCTGVGKAMLAQLTSAQVDAIVDRAGLAVHTEHTLTTRTALHAALARIRDDGYAIDDQEQEVGVRCVAVAVPGGRAVSVSGPVTRMTDDTVARAVPLLSAAAARLAEDEVIP